ncbi:MAG: hypothetical protein QOJ66_34, partial [Ilumatobacteraceae bacterium]
MRGGERIDGLEDGWVTILTVNVLHKNKQNR